MSSSCFEHSELFWVLFLEIMRVLKPNGLFYLNAPSNGLVHRYPVDCWRFYPDSGNALVTWAKRNELNTVLLESYTSYQRDDVWNDYVAVFLKDKKYIEQHPSRMIQKITRYTNGIVTNQEDFLREQAMPEDLMKLKIITDVINGNVRFQN